MVVVFSDTLTAKINGRRKFAFYAEMGDKKKDYVFNNKKSARIGKAMAAKRFREAGLTVVNDD